MSSMADLLKQEYEKTKAENLSSGGSFKTIALAQVDMGYNVFVGVGNVGFFPYTPGNGNEEAKAKAEAQEFADQNGGNDAGIFSSKGIQTTVYADGMILGNLNQDWTDFVGAYMSESGFGRKMTDEQNQALGNTLLPYDVVMNYLVHLVESNVDAPLGKPKWCTLGQVVNGYQKARGRKQQGKGANEGKEYDYRIFVIEEVHADRAAAQAAADKILGGNEAVANGAVKNDSSVSISEQAIATYGSVDAFLAMTDSLNTAITNAEKKLTWDGKPLPPPIASKITNEQTAREYVATEWGCLPEDLDQIVPF